MRGQTIRRDQRLIEAVKALSAARSIDDVRAVVRTQARAVLKADGIALLVREGDYVRYIEEDAVGPLWLNQRFRLSDCISGTAIKLGRPVVVVDVQADPRINQLTYRDTFVKSLLMIPVRPGEPLGALGIYWAVPHEATEEEIGQANALAGAITGALENVRLLEQLKNEKRFSDAVIDGLPGVFCLTDCSGRLLRWNRNLVTLSGHSPERLTSVAIADLVDDKDRGAVEQAMTIALEEGQSTVEASITPATRQQVPLYFTVVRSHWAGGCHLVWIGIDIRARVALEEQLRQAQKLEAVGRLAGGIAHDFNNMLTVISSYASMVGRGTTAEEAIEHIARAAERAAALTRQLMAFSRKEPAAPRVQSLNELVESVTWLLARLVSDNVQVVTYLDPDLPFVRVDKSQMEQVVLNLVVNAADAMPEGGVVTLQTRVASAAPPLDDKPVLLEVSDTGHGISPSVMEHIYEPFFTTKKPGQGTGLGLATVFSIVRQHGGEIQVDSRPTEGTTFRIYLPSAGEPLGPPSDVQPLKALGGDETILVVDDDEVVRRVIVTSLRFAGYHVLEASNGHEAHAMAESHKGAIDLLLTDIVMPGISGHELYHRLEVSRPTMAVLYVTGYPGAALPELLRPAIRVLEKPFSVEKLLRVVRESLAEHAQCPH